MVLTISTTKLFLAEILLGDYYFHRWTSKPTEIYETKNNVWKRCKISIQNSIDNRIEITKIKLDSAIKRFDSFEFTNPGILKLPLEDIYRGCNSKSRNPHMQTMLRLVGFGDNAGSGFPTILDVW